MTYVYREDNECVDSLKHVGRSLKCTHVLSNMSHFSHSNVVKNLDSSSIRGFCLVPPCLYLFILVMNFRGAINCLIACPLLLKRNCNDEKNSRKFITSS